MLKGASGYWGEGFLPEEDLDSIINIYIDIYRVFNNKGGV